MSANAAFQEWWDKEFRLTEEFLHSNKAMLLHCWQAATKAALGSRVVLPERKEEIEIRPDMIFLERAKAWSNEGFNDCLDQIKLVPLTAEQVDSFFPSEYENSEAAKTFCQTMEAKSGFLYGVQWLRESIKKRLGGV